MKNHYLWACAFIFVILFFVSLSNRASAELSSETAISDYKLPFVGIKTISQGPRCLYSHASNEAIDFQMAIDTPIYAATSGYVFFARWDPSTTIDGKYGFGNLIQIRDSDGNVSKYAHLNGFYVSEGTTITQGSLIGRSGNTSSGTQPVGKHLHFEVRDSENNPVSIRNISGISWLNPNEPCQPAGMPDGEAYGASINNGVSLFPDYNHQGASTVFNVPTYSLIEFPLTTARSIKIVTGWSAKIYPDIFMSGQCISQSYENLDFIYIYSYLGVRAIEVFDNPTCSLPPPFEPLICTSLEQPQQTESHSSDNVSSIGDGCVDPTPTPPPGVTPTPTPPPSQTGVWSAKVFSAINECNDSPDCSAPSAYYSTNVSGTNFNLNFPDGKPFGTGGDQWGMFLKQTVNLSPGTYYVHADHDDGVKVWVNGSPRMDVLGNSENNTTCPGVYLSGNTNLSILWKNTGGSAHLNFSIDQNGGACQSQQKWSVKYYHDPHLCSFPNCNLQQIFCETEVPGTWFHIDPYPGGTPCGDGDQTWGSIWKQTINFPEGDYVFWADHDDGVKIFLGDTNIMDLTVSENGNKACPAKHLSGDVPITVIHNNLGGDARINISWTTDTSACDQVAYNVWVWKDASDLTHVTVENGDINEVNLYLGRSGQSVEVTRSRWYSVSGGIEALIPEDVDSFLVDQGFAPTIGGGNVDEWYNGSDPHWVVRKKLFVWIDDSEQTRLTYLGGSGSPNIRFYTPGSSEQQTTSWWYATADGIEAVIPENVEAVKVDRWIRPQVEQSAKTWWEENSYWLSKRLLTVNLLENGSTRINYYWGLPLDVSLGRYGSDMEVRDDLWQSEVVDGHTNYFMTLPSDVVAFEIQGGMKPRIDDWATWMWGNYETGHWVSMKTSWVYKNANNETQVFYANPDVNPEDVTVIYYLFGNSLEHQTTSWWTKTDDGLMMTVPRNVEVFFLTRGPAPLLTDSVLSEWKALAENPLWIQRKPIRVWLDAWGSTYVTYWHEQILRPNIHYILNNQEFVTTDLWQNTGDGIQAIIPEGTTHFMIEANNQPYIESSADTVWRFSALPDLWMELINKPAPVFKIFLPITTRP